MNAKTIFFLVFLIPLAAQVSGQLTVNAGNDTTVCMCGDTIRLGGNPTASGGKEPYTYKWELLPVYYYDYRILSSDLLNDSTSANPFVNCGAIINDTVTFLLTVMDADSISKTDRVEVIISSINWVHLLYIRPTINQGDSVQLKPLNIDNGIAPFSYHWRPETGLSDPYIRNPFAKPVTSTRYTCIVTDAIGCSAKDINDVVVITTGVSDWEQTDHPSIIFSNPVTSDSEIRIINPSNEKLEITVINIQGQIILKDWFYSEICSIGKKIIDPGTYFFSIKNDKELLTTAKFVRSEP